MKLNTPGLALALSTLALLGRPAQGADWYQWRGPEQNGVSREANLTATWSPEGEDLVWTAKVGGMSSPIVMNGRVYVMSRSGEDTAPDTLVAGPKTQETLACMDANTGQILWQYHHNMTQTDLPFHRLGWSNVVGDPATGRVYAFGAQCNLICLDGKTGALIWQRQMAEEYGVISTFGGRTPSPAIDEDQVLIGGVAFGWGDHARGQHRLFAFNKMTGQLNWSNGTGGIPVDAPYNTPVVSVINGQRLVMLGAGDGGVHAFQARTGKKVWSFAASKRGINASLLVDGTRVYICHGQENLENSELGSVICLDVSGAQPKVVWRDDGVEAEFSSPTLADGRLYVLDNKGVVHALDASTGAEHWKKTCGTIGKASLVWGDGKLYVAEANGRVWILNAGEDKAQVLSKVELTEKLGREYVTFGSVAIANGRVYLQAANATYCFGSKEPVRAEPGPPAAATEQPPAADAKPAFIQVLPADALLRPGEKATFTARAFDAQGRLIGPARVQWSVGQLSMIPPPSTQPAAPAATQPILIGNLAGQVDADGIFTAENGPPQGGAVIASAGGITGLARVRVLPPLPWSFDFEKAPADKPPLTFVGAGAKFAVRQLADNKALAKLNDFDLYHAARTYLGPCDLANYTIQADVKVGAKSAGGQRQMPDVGAINSKYSLVLKGNYQTLQIEVWAGALPLSVHATMPFAWEPDKLYRLKLRTQQSAGSALVQGKAWPADQPEPAGWTIQLEDTQPNVSGSPGLFGESLVSPYKSDIYYDNVLVTENRP